MGLYVNNKSVSLKTARCGNISVKIPNEAPLEEYFVTLTTTEKGANLISFDSSKFDEGIILNYCLMETGSYSYIKIHESDEETITRPGIFVNYKDTGASVTLNLFKNGNQLYLCPDNSYLNYQKIGYVNVPQHTAWTNVIGAVWLEGPTRKIRIKLVNESGEDILEKYSSHNTHIQQLYHYDENKTQLCACGLWLSDEQKISETKTKYLKLTDQLSEWSMITIPATQFSVDDIDENNVLTIVVTEKEPYIVHLYDSVSGEEIYNVELRLSGSPVSPMLYGYTPISFYPSRASGTINFSLVDSSLGTLSPTSIRMTQISDNTINLTLTRN